MAPKVLDRRALNRALLARQLLLRREATTLARAVARLVGLQAQVAQPPAIGLWTRVEGFELEQLTRALQRRQLVRATMMRSTLHVMRAADYLALRAAIQPALDDAMRSALRKRLDGVDLPALVVAARERLAGAPMGFAALRSELGEHVRATGGGSATIDERMLGYAVRNLVPLVQVPDDSRFGFPAQADFCLAEEWLGAAPEPEQDRATLIRRYLAAFGPATPADAQTWSGLKGLREDFEAMGAKLRRFVDEAGRELFDLPRAPRPDPDEQAPVRLIPAFDNLILGHAERSRIVDDAHRKVLVTKNLQVAATFLVDGFVAGTWTLAQTKTRATLTLASFAKLSKTERAALRDEAGALLAFVAAELPRHAVEFTRR